VIYCGFITIWIFFLVGEKGSDLEMFFQFKLLPRSFRFFFLIFRFWKTLIWIWIALFVLFNYESIVFIDCSLVLCNWAVDKVEVEACDPSGVIYSVVFFWKFEYCSVKLFSFFQDLNIVQLNWSVFWRFEYCSVKMFGLEFLFLFFVFAFNISCLFLLQKCVHVIS